MDKRYIIQDTPNTRAVEKVRGLSFVGQELNKAYFYERDVVGYIYQEVVGGFFARRYVYLEKSDVVEFIPRPIDVVKAEAALRALE